jgi:hypothetical protein
MTTEKYNRVLESSLWKMHATYDSTERRQNIVRWRKSIDAMIKEM